VKKIFFFCLIVIYSCSANKAVHSGQASSAEKGDYIIEVRSTTPSSLHQAMTLFGGKITITQLSHNQSNFVLLDQTTMQLLCRDMSRADLQNLLGLLGQCAGIMEVSHYKL
jgi:hypothetical protein